jgi:hypothetical protein
MKQFLGELIPQLIAWGLSFLLISWLVEGSFWLHFFLATGASGASYSSSKLAKLESLFSEVDGKTDITDSEVVRISPMVDIHDDKIDELERKIFELQEEINDLKSGRG